MKWAREPLLAPVLGLLLFVLAAYGKEGVYGGEEFKGAVFNLHGLQKKLIGLRLVA